MTKMPLINEGNFTHVFRYWRVDLYTMWPLQELGFVPRVSYLHRSPKSYSRKRKQSFRKLAYSPKRAMAELRHSSSSLGSRASSSPMKRDEDASPLIHDHIPQDDDDDHPRHSVRDRDRSFWSQLHSFFPFFNDDPRVSQHGSRISLLLLLFVAIAGLISLFSILHRLVRKQFTLLLNSRISEYFSRFFSSLCCLGFSDFKRFLFFCNNNIINL